MNLNHLRSFYEVAYTLSFTKAAENLFLSQPAVTHAVNNLEEVYNVKLFDRTHRKIELTDAGAELYKIAESIFLLSNQSHELLVDYTNLNRGTINVDATVTFAAYFFPVIYHKFNQEYPNIHIVNNTGNTKRITEYTLNGQNDIAFVATPPENKNLEVITYVKDQLVAVVSKDHPLSKKKILTAGELHNLDMILREKGSAPRKIVDSFLDDNQINPNILFESGSTFAIKNAVQFSNCLSILSYQAVKSELAAGTLVELEILNTNLFYHYYLIHRKTKYLSKKVKAFLSTANSVLDQFS